MRRDSLEDKLSQKPFYAKMLHECWGCHAVGLRPGVLDTRLGDYGTRDYLGSRYSVLNVSEAGLCEACLKNPPADLNS
jgi:hypothetical protein